MSELPYQCSLVKHNVTAKHGSSKPLTSNELWLLELRIKNTRILASIPDALWDMRKLSIPKMDTAQPNRHHYVFILTDGSYFSSHF